MTLKPGASASIEFPIPAKLTEHLRRGELTLEHGPIFESKPNHFERMVEIRLYGQKIGQVTIKWGTVPRNRAQRLWDKLRGRKFDPEKGIRLELPRP
jgi:hypothetical protein